MQTLRDLFLLNAMLSSEMEHPRKANSLATNMALNTKLFLAIYRKLCTK